MNTGDEEKYTMFKHAMQVVRLRVHTTEYEAILSVKSSKDGDSMILQFTNIG